MKTKDFSKDFMVGVLDHEHGKIIEDEVVETTRGSIVNRLVFEYEDQFYETIYSYGATEYQDESPFEYDPDMINCTVVEPVEVTVTQYRPVE